MSTESVMPSNHLILCCSLSLQPSIFPSIRVFYNELIFSIRWPKYWSFSLRISPSNEYSGLISCCIKLCMEGQTLRISWRQSPLRKIWRASRRCSWWEVEGDDSETEWCAWNTLPWAGTKGRQGPERRVHDGAGESVGASAQLRSIVTGWQRGGDNLTQPGPQRGSQKEALPLLGAQQKCRASGPPDSQNGICIVTNSPAILPGPYFYRVQACSAHRATGQPIKR